MLRSHWLSYWSAICYNPQPTSSEKRPPYLKYFGGKKVNLGKIFRLDIFLTNYLDFTKTIIPLALMASGSIAHSWTIDSEPTRAQAIIVKYPFY